MSEYHLIDNVELTDEQVLIQTLQEMGYKPTIHAEAENLHGYMGDKRKNKAHIIIPRSQVGNASNDVGFEKVDGSYKLHLSEYDKRVESFKLKKLKQLYAKNKILVELKKKSKYLLGSQSVDKDGTIRIRLRRLGV